MKKALLIIFAAIVTLIPLSSSAANFTAGWYATTSTSTAITPSNINGTAQAINVNGTATSTINKLSVGSLIAPIFSSGTCTGNGFVVDNPTFVVNCTNDRIGISTTTPSQKLTIYTGNVSNANEGISLTRGGVDAGQTNIFGMRLKSDASGVYRGAFTMTTAINGAETEILSTGGSITNVGNIGIGTSSPSAKLSVTGTAGTSDIFAVASSTEARLFTITSAGNVGIGTSTPRNKLEIVGTAVSGGSLCDTSNDILCLQNTVATGINIITPATFAGAINFSDGTRAVGRLTYDHNTDALIMHTNSTERMRLTSAGNLLIGTSTTDGLSKLFVQQGSAFRSFRCIAATFGCTIRADDNTAGTSAFVLQNLDDEATTNHGSSLTWQFGTDSSETAITSGNIRVLKEQQWTSTGSTQDSYMAFATALDGTSAEKVRITSAGNVGIGTTSPATLLQVHNNTATSTLYVSSGGAGLGGRIILEDIDAAGCTEVTALNGVLSPAIVACPVN